ncbi:MAG: hypothetical protein ACYSR8_12280 [Planctomycetota bacterium]|jgi:energy-coupling factor transporter transmembrane protein EcfT
MVKKRPQTEKKKLRTIGRILKWTGLLTISFLIFLVLIFQAPWKVIALLLIILAACTVLPKPYRKWFWLSVAAIILVLIIWVFLPDRGQWKPYRHNFEQGLKSLNDKYAVPDQQNAAAIYEGLLQNYESGDYEPNLADSNTYNVALSQPWLSKDHPDLAVWLQGHKRTMATLLEATRIEKCRFPIDYNSLKTSLGQSTRPHLRPMKKLAWMLVCAANNDLMEKSIDEALEKQIALLRISEHLRQQPIAIDMKTGIAYQALALNRINRFLVAENPTEPHIDKLEDAVSEIRHDWDVTWAAIADCEKLSVMKDLFWMLYEMNEQGDIRITVSDFFRYFKPVSQQGVPYWIRKLAKAECLMTWFLFPQTPEQAAGIIEKTLKKYGKIEYINSQLTRESPLRFNFSYIIDLYVDSYICSMHSLFMRLKSDTSATGIIIALRRYKNKHGSWPEKLDDVKSLAPAGIFVDPVNGGSFVYKPTDESFLLYSKGQNNIDDGGEHDEWFEEETDADDWPIWPPGN